MTPEEEYKGAWSSVLKRIGDAGHADEGVLLDSTEVRVLIHALKLLLMEDRQP